MIIWFSVGVVMTLKQCKYNYDSIAYKADFF